MLPGEGPSGQGAEGQPGPHNELGLRCEGGYCPVPPLRYLGGLLQHEPNVHLVFWGSNWNSGANSAAKAKILELFEVLTGSSYQKILTQYFDPTGRISTSISVSSFVDTRIAAPSEVTFTSMEPEVSYAIEQKAWKREPNAQFVLLTAPGSTYKAGFGEFCAYHDVDAKGGVFSIVPWAGDAPFGTTDNCAGYYGKGDATKATSLLASHEYAESATDPLWDTEPGWKDLEGYELADMCATPYDEIPGKGISKVYVQGLYDDHQNSCSLEDKEPPHVLGLSDGPSEVTRHAARINATVNPESSEAKYRFEYGTTTAYGTSVPTEAQSVGSGNANVAVHGDLVGLQTEQIYHYRVVATNASGTTYGEDRTFLPSTWTIRPQAEPTRTAASWLEDVACPARETCVAVGHYYNASNLALAYVGSGSHWTWQALPAPKEGTLTNLEGIACSSSTACTAVGRGEVSGKIVPMAVRWNGSEWSLQSVPVPSASTYSALIGVDCSSSSECVGVGYYKNSEGVFVDYSSRWSGGAWSTLSTPNPTVAYSQSLLEDISCPQAGSCKAVGWYNPSAGGAAQKVIMAWNGSSWSMQSAAVSEGYLKGIDCTSPEFCLAVGGFGTAVERWGGSSWSTLTTPTLTESNSGYLGAVSCATSASCTAVGGAFSKMNDRAFTLAEDWNGSSWTVSGTPRESEQSYNEFTGTACTASSRCTAVGQSLASGTWEPLLETRPVTPVYEASFGSHGTGSGQFESPWGLDVDTEGNLWVADRYNNRVEKFNEKGEYLSQFGSKGSGNGQFTEPLDVAVAPNGDLWVTDGGNNRVEHFNSKGEYLSQFGSKGGCSVQFSEPWGIDTAPGGDVWVANSRYNCVEEFTSSGTFVRSVGKFGSGNSEFYGPHGISVDSEGHVWIADAQNNRVQELSSTGGYLGQFASKGAGDGQLEEPEAVVSTPSGSLLVADRWNGRVEQFNSDGEFETQIGTHGSGSGQMVEPRGVAVGPGGSIYVSDTWNNRIQKWFEPAPPTASTTAASEVTNASARVAGSINPGGLPTTYHFEYDTSPYAEGEGPHGTRIPVSDELIGSGKSAVTVTKQATELQPNTTYHFRVVASNEEGTVYGGDATFATPSVVGSQLGSMAVTDPFNASASPVSNFSSNWSALGWAAGSKPKGEDRTTGWGPSDAYSTINGAYYAPTVADIGTGIAAVATMATNPGNTSRYFSLWLDMSTPSGPRSGYQLTFTDTATNIYEVKLSKWVSGTQTALASKSGYSFSNGNSFAIVDYGGTVSAWTNTGSGFSELLSATDSSFEGGKFGVEGSGNITRLTNFKAGELLSPVQNTAAALETLALNDPFTSEESPLSYGGAFAALAWDNGAFGHNTGRVTSIGWGPSDAYSAINGAYWQKTSFADTGAGDAVAAKLSNNPEAASRYFALWLNMPSPASARSGYELSFKETSTGVYEVVLAKWVSGTETVLAAKTGYSFAKGSLFALNDSSGTVSAWTKTSSEYTQLLSASDATYTSGYSGIEGSGNITRLKEFRSGPLPPH